MRGLAVWHSKMLAELAMGATFWCDLPHRTLILLGNDR